ncbi:hypothetical protein LX32DRAFT_657870 [Colletotrichum zoysiae]|uniref:Uncharacterized protein n=1 Tax=Colletotrichum zoysiae TaxID=1216348 RepID=A0AAD9H4J0_9PEZI|nr:hypothetical protein LX32DRAFT_657870 [Colletotrichum zoysiae]
MQSRDRLESMQRFGKNIFNRKAKNRESNRDKRSSGSLCADELVLNGPTSTNRSHFITFIFGRHRASRQDSSVDDVATRRSLQRASNAKLGAELSSVCVSTASSPISSSLVATHFIVSQGPFFTIDSTTKRPGSFDLATEAVEPRVTSQATPLSSEVLEAPPDPGLPHAITTLDTSAWPLTPRTTNPPCAMKYVLSGRTCGSLVNQQWPLLNQSVPVLPLAQVQDESSNRPSSGASDTLGSFHTFYAQNALKQSLEVGDAVGGSDGASWEDDIDYCYKHEAEANCNYLWDCPPLDLVRKTTLQH